MSVFNATRLFGQTILVTGASSGIGAVRNLLFAWLFVLFYHSIHKGHCYPLCQSKFQKIVSQTHLIWFDQGGANVILVARRAEALKSVTDACYAAHKESGLSQGGKFASIQLDVSDKAQVARLWEKVPPELRDVDVLGNILSCC